MSRKLLFTIILIISLFALITVYLFDHTQKQKVGMQSDIQVQKLREQIGFMKNDALAVALTIAKNPIIIMALKENNPNSLTKQLSQLLSSYSENVSEIYRIQIHTPEKKLFFGERHGTILRDGQIGGRDHDAHAPGGLPIFILQRTR